MFASFRSLNFRLTAASIATFGALQLSLWFIIVGVVTHHLYQRYDADLLQRAQGIAASLDHATHQKSPNTSYQRILGAISPFESNNLLLEVQSIGTGEIVRSTNLRGLDLPPVEPAQFDVHEPRWETFKGPTAEALIGTPDPLRMVSLISKDPEYLIQVAGNLAPLQRTLQVIQQLLMIFMIASILTAAIVTHVVTGRSLAPLRMITRQARRLSALHIDERMPVASRTTEVAAMIEAINDMLDRFEEQFKNQQRFISNVGHELKTPLAVLLADLQIKKKRRADDPQLVEFFGQAEDEVRRMLRTVEGFLILTRAKGQRRLRTVADVSIEDVVLAAVRQSRKDAEDRGVQIVPQFSADVSLPDPLVLGDADLLTTMTVNLLSNAVRHSPPGQTVEMEVHSTPKEVQLFVRDRGPGILQKHHKRIFDMYYQVSSDNGYHGNAGIGLAIVKVIINLHGGTIAVENREGGGTQFAVYLPAVASPVALCSRTGLSDSLVGIHPQLITR